MPAFRPRSRRSRSPWGPTTATTTNGRRTGSCRSTRSTSSVHADHHRPVRGVRARRPAIRAPGVRDLPLVVTPEHEPTFRELAAPYVWRGGDPPRDRGRHPVTLVTSRRRHRLLPLAERPDRPAGAAAHRGRMGARGARRPRAAALSVGRRHRRVARELPARPALEAPPRHPPGRQLSAERLRALRHGRQRLAVGRRLVRRRRLPRRRRRTTRAGPPTARCAWCAAARG